jgi:hypothetical protein
VTVNWFKINKDAAAITRVLSVNQADSLPQILFVYNTPPRGYQEERALIEPLFIYKVTTQQSRLHNSK